MTQLVTRQCRLRAIGIAAISLLVASASSAQTFYTISATYDANYAQFPNFEVGPRTGIAQGTPTGTGVVPFSIPPDLFYDQGYTFQVFPDSPSVAQVVEDQTTSHPTTAFLAAGAGPGNLGWCPPAGNPANGNPGCLSPGSATAGLTGLLTYTQGPNQFGGTLKLILRTAGETSRRIATGPSQFNHIARTSTAYWAAGGTYELSNFAQRPPGVITQSPVLGPDGSIQTPGIYIGPGPTPPSIFQTGLPLTTGMIVGKDSRPSQLTLTWTGYDNRTAAGYGNIQLVGGSFFNQPAASPAQAFPGNTIITLTLPEPATSAGLAAGVLTVLALAQFHRRRKCA